ncbi:unnamed protein product [Moneuplotes crassus]|uniref:Uncharacterized protein n=1 Tax=Euplotes crassus TaxID=5936 RepID=A0AAD1X6Q8_EUPCR|nr:unnamed protein product [Moneuplotes crassus]
MSSICSVNKTPKMIGEFRLKEEIRQSTFNEVVNLVNEIGHLNSNSFALMGTYFSQKHEDIELRKNIIQEYKKGMNNPSRSVALHEKQIAIRKDVVKQKFQVTK